MQVLRLLWANLATRNCENWWKPANKFAIGCNAIAAPSWLAGTPVLLPPDWLKLQCCSLLIGRLGCYSCNSCLSAWLIFFLTEILDHLTIWPVIYVTTWLLDNRKLIWTQRLLQYYGLLDLTIEYACYSKSVPWDCNLHLGWRSFSEWRTIVNCYLNFQFFFYICTVFLALFTFFSKRKF